MCFAGEEHDTISRISDKYQLLPALENERFELGSRLIGSLSETHLIECFQAREKSCLHIIAAIRDTEQADKLCRQLLQRIRNVENREHLLNKTTVDEFEFSSTKVPARVAAIHIAAYNGNSGVCLLYTSPSPRD